MALMFPRLARNFVKNGYFPTDENTLQRVLYALAPAAQGDFCILDPCAGEGVALAECKAHLSKGDRAVKAYGVEYDSERASHAKNLLDRCIKGSIFDCVIGQRAFGLLFLNPPYGDKVADKGATGKASHGRQRLEVDFLQRSIVHLQFGGVLVLIVPFYVLNTEIADVLAKHCSRVSCFIAPEQQFKQAVIFGVKKRTSTDISQQAAIKSELHRMADGGLPDLPDEQWESPYLVPAALQNSDVKFAYSHIDSEQLAEEIERNPCLWSQFGLHFNSSTTVHRRPLRELSNWHLALALAAGQVSGVVTAADGRIYLIKGDTHKEKQVKITTEVEGDRITEIRTALDRFVPTIRALDFTPESATYGRALIIR
jgi:tRNA1(Val) A37 N6-methylase TrmN6